MTIILFFIFCSSQLLTKNFGIHDNFQREEVPAIQRGDVPAIERSLNLDNPRMGIRRNVLDNIKIQALLRNNAGRQFDALNSIGYANLFNLQRIKQRMTDEQNLQNLLRTSLKKDDEPSSLPLVRRVPFRLTNQNFAQFPTVTIRNSGIFDKIPNEEIQQQMTLRQILQQEKSILELLERNSRHNQLTRSNSFDLKNVQEKQQRIINLLINQQQQNNNGQVNGVDDSLFVKSELPEQSIFSSVEDIRQTEPLQIGNLFQIPFAKPRKSSSPVSKQQYLFVSPKDDQFQFMQISPYKQPTLGNKLVNNVGSSLQVFNVPDTVITSSVELNKGDTMLIRQSGQQTADIYGSEEIKVEKKPNSQVNGITNTDDSSESTSSFSNEDNGVMNTTESSDF